MTSSPTSDKLKKGDNMTEFKIVRDYSEEPICGALFGQTAENEKYRLKWFYDGDYRQDKQNHTIRNSGIVVDIKAKKSGLNIVYVPDHGEPLVKLSNHDLKLCEIDSYMEALKDAKEAAELAIAFMQPKLST